MKFCKNCSAALDDDAMFCTECGVSLTDDFKPAANNTESQSSNSNYEGFQGSIPTPSNRPSNNDAANSSYSSNNNDYSSGNSYSSSNSEYSSNTNYSQPQNQYSAPQGKNPGTPWLIVSIISLFCCGGLFAIPGLILAIMSTTSFNAGNVMEAEQRANTAKWLSIGAIILAVILVIVLLATGAFYSISEGYYY